MTTADHTTDHDTSPLTQAIAAASLAPSIFNTQPWRWQVEGDTADLQADRSRQLQVVDPNGRMMTVSCGVALHHAMVALTAGGHIAEIMRFPASDESELLARLHVTGQASVDPMDMRRYQSLLIRRTDRRPFPKLPVPEEALAELRAAAESQGAHLQLLRHDQVLTLTSAVGRAENTEMADPAYRAELHEWTHRPAYSGDGVPLDSTPGPTPRRVPVREFATDGRGAEPDAEPADLAARYALVFTDGDTPADWLTAGEALSAVLLAAVETGLAVSPMSDVIEVPSSRETLRGLLAGIGYPQIALRIGVTEQAGTAPAKVRRNPGSFTETTPERNRS